MTTLTWPDIAVPILLLSLWIAWSPLPVHFKRWYSAIQKDRFASDSSSADELEEEGSGYIIPVLIHHARILPKESQHSFRYPSIFLALNLEDLENGRVEDNLSNSCKGLARRIFSWKPKCKGRWSLTKLDPDGFGRRTFTGMQEEMQRRLKDSMLLKLMYELRLRGYIKRGPQDMSGTPDVTEESSSRAIPPWSSQIGQVWAVAMPSLLGLGGFNPLTVYYVYRPSKEGEQEEEKHRGDLWLVILEVHNTFNERHVYICEVGKMEDEDKKATRRRNYQHSWTFPRAFHVSPFNDRSGYYQLLMNDLWSSSSNKRPTLDIRLLLMTEAEDEDDDFNDDSSSDKTKVVLQKKLLATLCSSDAPSASLKSYRQTRPLTSINLFIALLSQPLDLILPVSRIMWEAAKLHWMRRLPVFIRPEQRGQGLHNSDEDIDNQMSRDDIYDGVGWPVDLNPTQIKQNMSSSSGAIYWNQDGFIERACQKQFEELIIRQMQSKDDVAVSIISRNAEVAPVHFYRGKKSSEPKGEASRNLIIYTLSSSIYLDFALYTPRQARLFGSIADRNWGVNSIEIFESLFDTSAPSHTWHWRSRLAAWTRRKHLRFAAEVDSSSPEKTDDDHKRSIIVNQLVEDLDNSHPYNAQDPPISLILALLLQLLLMMLTASISRLLHIRYVRAPWASVGEGIQYLQQHHRSFKDTPAK